MLLYCKTWNLCVNPSKTKIVVFSKEKLRNKPQFMYDNISLDIVEDFIYLGVKFKYNGSYNKQQLFTSQQANKRLFSLISKSKNINLELYLQIELFEGIVLPVLLYGAVAWGLMVQKSSVELH